MGILQARIAKLEVALNAEKEETVGLRAALSAAQHMCKTHARALKAESQRRKDAEFSLRAFLHQLREAEEKATELERRIERGGLDQSPCKGCGVIIVCISDGLPMCESCAAQNC